MGGIEVTNEKTMMKRTEGDKSKKGEERAEKSLCDRAIRFM